MADVGAVEEDVDDVESIGDVDPDGVLGIEGRDGCLLVRLWLWNRLGRLNRSLIRFLIWFMLAIILRLHWCDRLLFLLLPEELLLGMGRLG